MENDEQENSSRSLIGELEEFTKDVDAVQGETDRPTDTANTAGQPASTLSNKSGAPIVVAQLARDIVGMQNFEKIVKETSDFVTSKFKNGLTKEQVERVHANNSLAENQFKTAKDFMKGVMYQVPLHKLYKPLGSCQFNSHGKFCPVSVKINDETIKENNGGMAYLIQVWTLKGELVYEKPLKRPVANWNMKDDRFMFQEKYNSTDVWLVKLFEDKAPVIYKFELPESVVADGVNSKWNEEEQNYIIPEEEEAPLLRQKQVTMSLKRQHTTPQFGLDDDGGPVDLKFSFRQDELSESKVRRRRASTIHEELDLMRSLGEVHHNAEEQDLIEGLREEKSISQRFSKQLIRRSPDKMLDYLGGFILLAYRHQLIYIDLKDHNVDETKNSASVIEVKIEMNEIEFFDLEKTQKIIAMQEIGKKDMSCIVLEHLLTREITFLRVDVPSQNDDGVGLKLKFFQLGIIVNKPNLSRSPLLKYRSVAKFDPVTKKHYQVGLVLRENGSFEVYSDFMLVNEYYNPLLQCVDFLSDFDHFYLKFVECDLDQYGNQKVDQDTKAKELITQIRQVRHSWRNKISFQTSVKKGDQNKWKWVIHKRIAKFFNMYTQILNFEMYMLVAHRNMISVYDMVSFSTTDDDDQNDDLIKGEWVKTIPFDAGSIRSMFIKKKPKHERQQQTQHDKAAEKSAGLKPNLLTSFEKYKVMILIGVNNVGYLTLDQHGEIKTSQIQDAPGRIINFKDDFEFGTGTALLIDNASTSQREFEDRGEAKVYTFPFGKKDGAEVSLYCLKIGEFYKLLSEKDGEAGKCISHDCYFSVMSQNDAKFFQSKQDALESNQKDEDDKDPVMQAFRKQEKVTAMIVTSLTNKCCRMFPLVKEVNIDENQNKTLKGMRLITNKENSKDVALQERDLNDKSSHLETFFNQQDDHKKYNKNFAKVTENQMIIYDDKQKPKLIYEGLKIRECASVHDNYLYTISDAIETPFSLTDYRNDEAEVDHPIQESFCPSGFYVYDMDDLFGGRTTKYKLASTVGGFANILDDSKFADRISFLQSFDNIVMMPFPHVNLLSCVGMGHKSEYLIWREKNGFFTALDTNNNLLTWATLNGKMLYNQSPNECASPQYVDKYEVYRSDNQDIVHTQNFSNFEKYSLSLLKSKQPVDDQLQLFKEPGKEQKSLKLNEAGFYSKKDKQLSNNNRANQKKDKSAPQLGQNLFKTSNQELEVEIVNSQQRSNIYHFKVYQLESHEDTKNKKNGEFGSICKLRFHFFHELLQYQYNKDLKDFDWDVNSAPQQRLYLSQDTMSMMEVTNNFIATVYRRASIDDTGKSIMLEDEEMFGLVEEPDDGQQVNWEVYYRISQFPTGLAQETSVNFLFSPNFQYQFDYNYSQNQFLIKETSTQHIYYEFPVDLIDTIWNNIEGQNSIKIIASRFKWESDKTFRILNRSNLDCIFELRSHDANDLDPTARYIKLISVVKVDNMHMNMVQIDSAHLLLQPCELKVKNVLERLIRQSQTYKTAISHALNTNNKEFNILYQLNKIDYFQNLDSYHASFNIDLTYTWLDWRIMDMIKRGSIKMSDVDSVQQLQMCFNILPGGKSFLHLLAEADESSHSDQIQAYSASKSLFETASKTIYIQIKGKDDDGCSFEVPILPDIYGQTSLDHCMGLHYSGKKIFQIDEKRKGENDSRNVENIAMAEVIFNGIKNYGFMHSSSFIVEAITRATKLGLPSIIDYFNHTMKSVEHSFTSKTENAINKDHRMWGPKMGHYARQYIKIWVPEKKIKDEIFNRNSALQPMNMRYLDLPYIYRPNKQGQKFIYALTKCKELELFNLASVQTVIDCHASHWNRTNYLAVGLPMILNLFFFWYWSNIILTHIDFNEDDFYTQDIICRLIITCTGVYLFLLEISAIYTRGKKYFSDMGRLFNLFSQILIQINVFYENDESRQQSYFWTLQTWAALAIWFRFLLYLRTISKFSWLIRMIVYCVLDMTTFLVVFAIGVIAFADAFLSIEQIMVREGKMQPTTPYNPHGSFYEKYLQGSVVAWRQSFNLAALASPTDDVANYADSDWIVVCIAILFNIIVLLNLLIAIISDTYSRIAQDQVANGYKEKAQQIGVMQDQLGARYFVEDPIELVWIANRIISDDIEDESEEEEPERMDALEQKMNLNFTQLTAQIEGLKDLLVAKKNN